MDILIVASGADLPVLESTLEDLIKYMDPSRIRVITNTRALGDDLAGSLDEISSGKTDWIDEDSLYPGLTFDSVKAELTRILGFEPERNRTGWYFQQFLKMAYAHAEREEYYFQLDADVLLLKPLPLYDDGKPCFFVRREYNRIYFETMDKLLGIKKQIPLSFISETMLFKTEIMRDIIRAIEDNKDIPGESFWVKILNAIPADKVNGPGFSEYETYGTYTMTHHPDAYRIKEIPSLRSGKRILGSDPSEEAKRWASKSFVYAGIEKWDRESPVWKKLSGNPLFRSLCPASAAAFLDRNILRIINRRDRA